MTPVLLLPAQDELIEARDYYLAHANPNVAASFLKHVQSAIELLCERSDLGTPISKRLRSWGVRRFPYSIIYRVVNDELVVHAIAHQRRRPGYWRDRRPPTPT
jgi:toxin ParE1/3/4